MNRGLNLIQFFKSQNGQFFQKLMKISTRLEIQILNRDLKGLLRALDALMTHVGSDSNPNPENKENS